MQYIGRDPFGRMSLFRKSVNGKCEWCGQQDGRGKVGEYIVEEDSGRSYSIGKFCSKSCATIECDLTGFQQ